MCAPELKRRFTLDTLVGIIDIVDFGGIGHAFLVDHNCQVIFSLDKGPVMTNLKDIYPDRALRIECKRSINPARQDGIYFQEAGAEAGEQFQGSSAS